MHQLGHKVNQQFLYHSKINSQYYTEIVKTHPNLAMNVHEEESLLQMTAGLMDTMMTVKFVHRKRVLWVNWHQTLAGEFQQQNIL